VDDQPGIYTVSVTKAGFSTTKAEHQEVEVGVNLSVNLSLQVGGGSTVVEVSAVGNELQTMNATVGNTITNLTIDNLPSLGRDVSTFVELQPGVGPDGSVGGAVLDQSYFSLDGGNNSNDMDGSMSVYTMSYAGDPTGGVATQNNIGAGSGGPTGVIPTPQDSIEEVKVNTAGQTADFNSSAGAEVKIVTKRGTNAWHGTGYEYYKDNSWSSNSWQNNFDGVLLPSFHYSRYGGAIGGPIIPKEVLGGKTYFFFNYEGFNFPLSQTIDRNVPSPALRLGLITDPITSTVYNVNPYPVTYNGNTYAGSATTIDPLGIGIDPVVQSIWNTYEPQSNSACLLSLCDGTNVLGFSANVLTPTTSKFVATRIDHDFSPKWHFSGTYHYFKLTGTTTDQIDIGGFFSGDKLGVPAAKSIDPQNAFMLVGSVTTNVTTNLTNDFHYSFLRNFWNWERAGDVPQASGLGGALEIYSGESCSGCGLQQDLAPFNVDTQNTRTRYWDGHDQMIRDDISLLKGNHLFQFGGTYQHNWDQHQRTDIGGGINYAPVYQLGTGSNGSNLSSDVSICSLTYIPSGSTSSSPDIQNCGALTSAVLGMVSISQVAYTRSGASLTLNPPLTPATTTVKVPYYNTYFSDTWHMKPTFTFTYGLGWTLEMPPVETTGKQDVLVDQSDTPVSAESYFAARRRAALIGQAYNPELGFALVGNVGNGLKYPYNPFYGEFSPRVAIAWSPHFDADSMGGKVFGHDDTVIRAGYGRVYGRLNGVDQVLVPLLGVGPIQPTECAGNLSNGQCSVSQASPSTAFRIGSTENGLVAPLQTSTGSAPGTLNLIPTTTLPQPIFPGINSTEGAASEALDPHFRPNQVDSFDLTVQRQLTHRVTLEVGYIFRRIRDEYQPLNLNAVPYMLTLGGQSFANAYAQTVLAYCGGVKGLGGGGCAGNAGAVTNQPFFETALAGTKYCQGYSSCTQGVIANEGSPGSGCGVAPNPPCLNGGAAATGNLTNASVWSLFSDLDQGATGAGGTFPGFQVANSMLNTGPTPQFSSGVSLNASVGYGNYNAGFASLKMADWRGLTAQSNFTWSKALGTGADVQATSEYTADDPFNLGTMYGYQNYNRKFVYNLFFVYQPPFFKGQSGIIGRALGGWSFSSIFTAGTGTPIELYTSTGDGQEFGAGDNINFFGNENALAIAPEKSGHAYYNKPSNGLPVNIFQQGVAAVANFRNPILGYDTKDGGNGNLIGLPYWNMDFSVRKNLLVAEGFSLEFQSVFANFLNHNQFLDPVAGAAMGLFNPGGWGALNGGSAEEQIGGIRQIELGIRIRF
jgi:hypothetical protein